MLYPQIKPSRLARAALNPRAGRLAQTAARMVLTVERPPLVLMFLLLAARKGYSEPMQVRAEPQAAEISPQGFSYHYRSTPQQKSHTAGLGIFLYCLVLAGRLRLLAQTESPLRVYLPVAQAEQAPGGPVPVVEEAVAQLISFSAVAQVEHRLRLQLEGMGLRANVDREVAAGPVRATPAHPEQEVTVPRGATATWPFTQQRQANGENTGVLPRSERCRIG